MNEHFSDHALEGRLHSLYEHELARASADLQTSPIACRPQFANRLGMIAGSLSAVAVAVVLLLAFGLRPSPAPNVPGGAAATDVPSTTPTTEASATELASTSPTAAPVTAAPTPGASQADQGGIPSTIDGQPVATGEQIAAAIASATDDTPFLIGGWFPAGDNYRAYCQRLASGPESCTPYLLHLSKGSTDSVFVYPEASDAAAIQSYMATQPVVMRVHIHDSRCQELPNLDGCENRLVLEQIVWLGPTS